MSQVRSPSIDLKTPETTTKPTPMDVRKSMSGAPLNASDGKLTTRRFLPLLERDNLQRIANETGQSQISENGSPILPKLGTQSQTHVWNKGNGQVQILRVHITTVRSINASALPFDPKVPGSIRKSLKDFDNLMDTNEGTEEVIIDNDVFKDDDGEPEFSTDTSVDSVSNQQAETLPLARKKVQSGRPS